MLRASVLFLLFYLLAPAAISAQCRQWDFSGQWEAWLGDTKVVDRLDIKRGGGTNLSGKAEFDNPFLPFPNGGSVTGRATRDNVQFEIRWDNGKETILENFKGTIGTDGSIKGQARIYTLAGALHVDWVSSRPMKCQYKEFGD